MILVGVLAALGAGCRRAILARRAAREAPAQRRVAEDLAGESKVCRILVVVEPAPQADPGVAIDGVGDEAGGRVPVGGEELRQGRVRAVEGLLE